MSDLIYQFSQQAHPGRLTSLGQGINQLVTQKRARDAEITRKENLAIARETAMASGKDEDWANVLNLSNPEEFAKNQAAFQMMDTVKRENVLRDTAQLNAGMLNDPQGMGAELLDRKVRSLEAENRMDEASDYRFLLDKVKSGDPDEIKTVQGMLRGMATGIPGYKEISDQFLDLGQEERDEGEFALKIMEAGADLEWDQETIDAGKEAASRDEKYGEVITSALNYAKALEGGLGLDPLEYDKQIYGLRDEWMKYTEEYTNATTSYNKINESISSAMSETDSEQKGLSDLTGLTTFQRMIDDGVVRAEDVNNIKGANAFMDQLGLIIAKVEGGDILSDPQRREMLRLSQEFQRAQKRYVDEVAFPPLEASLKRLNPAGDRYTEVFGQYKKSLTPEETFWTVGGGETTQEPTRNTGAPVSSVGNPVLKYKEADLPSLRAHVKKNNPQSSADFDSMNEAQLSRYRAYNTFTGGSAPTETNTDYEEVDW